MRLWILITLFASSVFVSFPCTGVADVPVGVPIALACAPTDHNVGAALMDDVIWVTGDRGRSWALGGRVRVSRESKYGAEENTMGSALGADLSTGDSLSSKKMEDQFLKTENPPVYLAVSDTGGWAVWLESFLFFRGPGGVISRKKLEGIKGLFFDRSGRLWGVLSSSIVVFSEGGHPRQRWRASGARRPAPDPESGDYLVPAAEGVLKVITRETRVDHDFRRVPSVDAVAIEPRSRNLYIARRGFLELMDGLGKISTIARLPWRSRRILVDSQKTIWVSPSENGPWHRLNGNNWVEGLEGALAVDAAGDLWKGKAWGPGDTKPSAFEKFPPATSETPPPGFIVSVSPHPGPPPCSRVSQNLVPRAGVVFFWGRGISLGRATPGGPWGVGRVVTDFDVRLTLTWDFAVVSKVFCLKERRRWSEARAMRWVNAKEAWTRLRLFRAKRNGPTNILSMARGKLNQAYYRDLIHLYGGRFRGENDDEDFYVDETPGDNGFYESSGKR